MEVFIEEKSIKQKKKMVAFELNQDWYDLLKEEADLQMISISNLIRKLIYKNCIEEKLAKLINEKELKN